MKEVFITWDTANMGLIDPNHAYRIHVIVDPDNQVPDEIHEWKDPKKDGLEGWTDEEGRLYHGDNEGYYPPSGGFIVKAQEISPPETLSAPLAAGVNAETPLPGVYDMSMHHESLAIKTSEGLQSAGEIRVPLGGRYKLRAHIEYSNEHHPHKRYVVFHDHNHEITDEVLGVKNVYGISSDTYVWQDWTPKEPGDYELWAVLLEHSEDPNPDNASDLLHVTVYDPNDPTQIEDWQIHR
jgi:hypothetical protein